MGHKRTKGQRRALRRQNPGPCGQHAPLFLEGADSYEKEYERLVKQPPISGRIIVHEMTGQLFRETTDEQKLALAGFPGYTVVYYDVDYDNTPQGGNQVGIACTISAVSDERIPCPFVFISSELQPASVDPNTAWAIRTLMLLHEYGHAEDILRGVNYNHAEKKIDLVEAELYAHQFVLTHCRNRGYRQGCGYYLQNLEQYSESPAEYQRVVAREFFARNDTTEIRAWGNEDFLSNPSSPYCKEAMRRARKGKLR